MTYKLVSTHAEIRWGVFLDKKLIASDIVKTDALNQAQAIGGTVAKIKVTNLVERWEK